MLRRVLVAALLAALTASALTADVSILERKARKHQAGRRGRPGNSRVSTTGAVGLIDAQGLEYSINTNITFSTSSSASGAVSKASFTHSVAASTSGGGTTSSTLTGAFTGYNGMCLSLNNTVATCETGNANFVIYNQDGPATTECPGTVSKGNRQLVFNPQTIGSIQVFRKVFVPDNDQFARWLNYFTNTGGSPQTVTMVTSNDLGAGTNTKIVTTSSGSATVDTTDTWVTTFKNYTGSTSSEPRLGHVLQGPGAAVPLAGISFEDGHRNPFWGYTFTLNPGETKIIGNFVTGQPSKAAAAAKAAEIVGLPANAVQCMSMAERAELANFQAAPPGPTVPTLSPASLAGLGLLLAAAAIVLLRRRAAALPG
jgi:hypothetical protein